MSAAEVEVPVMSDAQIEAGIAGYTEQDRADLRWMVAYTRDELDGSRERLCEKLDCDWTTVSRILRGAYNAPIDSFLRKVRNLRANADSAVNSDFVPTIVTEKIGQWMDYALAGDKDGGLAIVIRGETRRGKTTAVKQWIHANRGKGVYVDTPATGGQLELLREMAAACGLGGNKNVTKLAPALVDCFHRNKLLAIDEIARVIPTERTSRPKAIEFVRRLHDVKRIPLVFIVTPQTWLEVEHGELRKYFEQLVGRVRVFDLPVAVRNDELRAICADACGGAPEAKMIAEARKSADEVGKLEFLFEDLANAGRLAAKRREKLNGEHLRIARLHRTARGQWPADEEAGK